MKRALISGGSGTIGAAICKRLARDGMHIIVHANASLQKAEAVKNEIQSFGGSAEVTCFDATDASATESAIKELLRNGEIQILINNAGIHDDAPMAGMTQTQWRRVIDVSLNGFFNLTQPLLLPMITTRWGRIVSISSIAALIGNRGQTNYAAAKAGIHGASRSLAIEIASRGITVNVVAPGIIESPMTENSFDPKRIKTLVPMQRAGLPDEVAALVAFLVSEEAAYISGQVISINGAMG